MGRKKIPIDWQKVDNYLKAHCDGAAIARILGMHPNTLYLAVKAKFNCDFSEYLHEKRAEGIALMEASIFRDSMNNGGADRMFWLKNKAGWKDKQEISANIKMQGKFIEPPEEETDKTDG